MNKKEYEKPAMREVMLQHTGMLMMSDVRSIGTNLDDDDIIFGGTDENYNGGAR